MKLDTVVGTLDWANSPIKSVAKMAIAGGQWRVEPNGDFNLAVVSNQGMPQVPVTGPFQMKIGA